eukprot:1159491-Pelagomonas_calceolata.AAC.26
MGFPLDFRWEVADEINLRQAAALVKAAGQIAAGICLSRGRSFLSAYLVHCSHPALLNQLPVKGAVFLGRLFGALFPPSTPDQKRSLPIHSSPHPHRQMPYAA